MAATSRATSGDSIFPIPTSRSGSVELIAKLTDTNGKAQPITTGVRIEIDQNNNVDRYLFVGTGKLLAQQGPGVDDINDASVINTLYVIRDGTRTAAELAPAKQTPARAPYSRADLNAVDGRRRGRIHRCGDRPRLVSGRQPMRAQKIGTDVFADVQTVVYSFSKPSTDPCAPPLSSTLVCARLHHRQLGASV